jgi:hypothetical protein
VIFYANIKVLFFRVSGAMIIADIQKGKNENKKKSF